MKETVRQEEVMEKVKRKQRAWKEKLEKIEDDRLVKKVYTEEIVGIRPRGRLRKKLIYRQFLAIVQTQLLYINYCIYIAETSCIGDKLWC